MINIDIGRVKVSIPCSSSIPPEGKLTLLLVYVDGMIVAEDDEHEKQILKEKFVAHFEMKDLGKLKYFHGIEVAYSKKDIFIYVCS